MRIHPAIGLLLAALLLFPTTAAAQAPAAGGVSATTLTLPSGPGSVQGLADAASVNVHSAQVGYSIPVSLPQDGNLSPSLALSYSGDLGNGSMGIGWSMARPSIHRSTREGVPSYTAADELILQGVAGGGRLIPLPNKPNEYRLEGAGNSVRILKVAGRYEVTDPDGTQYYFGLFNATGRQPGLGAPYAWFLELIVDNAGHSAQFSYRKDSGAVYLDNIIWGPENGAGKVYKVEMNYEDRPDPTVSFKTGLEVVTDLRLQSIVVTSFAEELRRYNLTYEESFAVTRLESVTMTGRGGIDSLPTTSFEYDGGTPSELFELDGTGGWHLDARGVGIYDVDGDGVSDLLRMEVANHAFRKNHGGSFDSAGSITGANAIAMEASTFMDLDGDARPDLIRIVGDTWRVYKLEGTEWVGKGEWPGTDGVPFSGPGVARADINGDGRTDIIRAATSGIIVHFAEKDRLAPGVLVGQISPGDSPVEAGRPNVRFHDVNGDGLSDVVWMTDGWMKYFLGRGDGTFKSWGRVFYPWGQGAFDLNLLRLADLNRDGLIDLVRIINGKVIYYPGDADFRFTRAESAGRHLSHPDTANVDTTITFADMNGNGSQDVVWSSPTGMWALDLAGSTSAGMLAAINNGLGGRTVYEYEGSGELSIADENRGDAWNYKLPQSIPVPTRTLTYPGNGEERRIATYSVRDGYWDGEERRFGGFLLSRAQTAGLPLDETAVTETRYRIGLGTNRVLRGVAWHSHVESGTGDVIEVNEKQYETRLVINLPPDNPLSYAAALLEDRSFHYEGVAEPIQTLTTYEYDAEVRPVRVMNAGRLDEPGDEIIARTLYAPTQEQPWVKNRTCEEFLYDAEDPDLDGVVDQVGLLNHTRTIFGDDTNIYDDGSCTVGKGWVRRKDGELYEAGVPRWVELEYSEFDARGNVTMTRAGGVERTLGYDAIGLFPTSESMVNDDATTLSWTATWDNALGVAITNTDPNGITSKINYDSLGRVESMSMGNFAPHVHYRYEWEGPSPKTFSYTFNGTASDLALYPNHLIGDPWSESVSVANGIGEGIYSATRLDATNWIISGWQDRDKLGRTTFVAEAFTHESATLPTVRSPTIVGQSLEYDAFGRTIRQILPTGDGKSVSFAAFSVTVNADDMAPVTSTSDGLGRILRTQRTIANAGGVGSTTESVDATYDGAGRILAMSLQDGAVEHTFSYDSLGRLIFADDPDIGQRNLVYNDIGQLLTHTNAAGQATTFTYDILGRLSTQTGEAVTPPTGSAIPAVTYAYHYDAYPAGFSLPGGALPGAGTGYLAGRLAAVEEPNGSVTLAYDEFGRPRATNRTIGTEPVSEFLTLGMSGQVQNVMYGHDLSVSMDYDGAGRALSITGPNGALWEAIEYDPAGRLIEEKFGNDVRQLTERDILGLPSRVQVQRPLMAGPLYDVSVTRNAWTGILSATDIDLVGLNHSATFTYDGAARLTDATIGTGNEMYNFGYRYDGLQNMTLRTQTGPSTLPEMATGTYHYGENNAGPRQLTSVRDPAGTLQDPPLSEYVYDNAGRMTEDAGRTLTYNGLDQLVQVDLPGNVVPLLYSYGYNGQRTYTQHADGSEEYNFTESIRQEVEADGTVLRHHYLKIGARTVARISMRDMETGTGSGASVLAPPPSDTTGERPLRTVLLFALFALIAFFALRQGSKARGIRAGPAWATVPLLVLFASNISCGALFGSSHQATWTTEQTIYFHQGFSAGPTMMTDSNGDVFEERRYEPFGVDIDTYSGVAGGAGATLGIDFSREPTNILNKASDEDTKWSYHGARWVSPQTARWHTPDPIVKAPDAKFMAEPWALHPYQYVEQNPVIYWDPDGRDKELKQQLSSRIVSAQAAGVSRKTINTVTLAHLSHQLNLKMRAAWKARGRPGATESLHSRVPPYRYSAEHDELIALKRIGRMKLRQRPEDFLENVHHEYMRRADPRARLERQLHHLAIASFFMEAGARGYVTGRNKPGPFDALPAVRPRSQNALSPVDSQTLGSRGFGNVEIGKPYLYVVSEAGQLSIALRGAAGKGGVKHTQLTGGAPAKAAGELQFGSNGTVQVNAQSGRYRAQSPDAVKQVAGQLEEAGYTPTIVNPAF